MNQKSKGVRIEQLMRDYYKAIAQTRGHNPSWIDLVARPLCEALAKAERRTLILTGPSGLGCDVIVDLHLPWDAEDITSLIMRPMDLGSDAPTMGVVDFGRLARDYPRDSVAWHNGLQYHVEPVPRDEDPIPFLQERLRSVTIRPPSLERSDT